ncbi:MAG: hypothetical protein JWQ35_952 [Bacteriovoracaceae bacterium]|nr:hypothetical protein [Bacteriovoracaceae bacterium]
MTKMSLRIFFAMVSVSLIEVPIVLHADESPTLLKIQCEKSSARTSVDEAKQILDSARKCPLGGGATVCRNGELIYRDTATGEETKKGKVDGFIPNADKVESLIVNKPDEKNSIVYSIDSDGKIEKFNSDTGEVETRALPEELAKDAKNLKFSGDQNTLVRSDGKTRSENQNVKTSEPFNFANLFNKSGNSKSASVQPAYSPIAFDPPLPSTTPNPSPVPATPEKSIILCSTLTSDQKLSLELKGIYCVEDRQSKPDSNKNSFAELTGLGSFGNFGASIGSFAKRTGGAVAPYIAQLLDWTNNLFTGFKDQFDASSYRSDTGEVPKSPEANTERGNSLAYGDSGLQKSNDSGNGLHGSSSIDKQNNEDKLSAENKLA